MGLKLIYQAGMFPWGPGHFLMIDIDAPPWAHDLLSEVALCPESTYQILEGNTTLVGYEFGSAKAVKIVSHMFRTQEADRFTNKTITSGE